MAKVYKCDDCGEFFEVPHPFLNHFVQIRMPVGLSAEMTHDLTHLFRELCEAIAAVTYAKECGQITKKEYANYCVLFYPLIIEHLSLELAMEERTGAV